MTESLLSDSKTKLNLEKIEGIRIAHSLPKVEMRKLAYGDGPNWTLARKKAVVGIGTDKLFGIHSDGYRLVPHEVGVHLVEEVALAHNHILGPYETDVALYDEGRRMRATLRFFETEYQVTQLNGQKDLINPTIEYFNSYDGGWAEKLIFGAFRLVCSNGMVVGKKLFHDRVIHVGERPVEFFMDLESSIKQYKDQTKVWKHWHTVEAELEHIEAVKVPFNYKQQDLIDAEIETTKKLTLWLLFNVITAVITHNIKSLQRQVILQNHLRQTTAAWPTN